MPMERPNQSSSTSATHENANANSKHRRSSTDNAGSSLPQYEDYLHPIFPSLSWTTRSPTMQQRRHILLTSAHDPSILIPPLSMSSGTPKSPLRSLSPTKFLMSDDDDDEDEDNDVDDQEGEHWRDHPDFGHLRWMLAALLLTTLLACLSGWDAKAQCISTEVYALSELLDDDSLDLHQLVLEDESSSCIDMFRWVMLPVGLVTLCLGTCGVVILTWTLSRLRLEQQQQQLHHLYSSHEKTSQLVLLQRKRQETADVTKLLRTCLLLAALFFIILAVWTYGIIAIMLRPRYNVKVGEDNPYQSLAAVDAKGHVGDNANLYYLAWISEGLGVAILYQVSVDAVRLYLQTRWPRRMNTAALPPRAMAVVAAGIPATAAASGLGVPSAKEPTHRYREPQLSHAQSYSGGGDVEATLSYTSTQIKLRRQQRITWYHSMYRLRLRSGIWVAALFSTMVLFISATQFWNWVLVRKATRAIGYAPDNMEICRAIRGSSASQGDVELCYRTGFGILSGCVGTIMCGAAILLHILARRTILEEQVCWTFSSTSTVAPSHHSHDNISLQSELVLSFGLSVLLGCNAVACTGIRGPAANVGNLYYASWLSFLLCLRNCLGCLEEFLNIDDDHQQQQTQNEATKSATTTNNKSTTTTLPPATKGLEEKHVSWSREPSSASMSTTRNLPDSQLQYKQDTKHMEVHKTDSFRGPNDGHESILKSADSVSSGNSSQLSNTDPLEKERAKRLRSYFFLGIFSFVCAASAMDAANGQYKTLTSIQWYMISAPCVVVLFCSVQFAFCLRQRSYPWVAHFCCGGVLSIITFLIWLANLVMTMHSEGSWAVNEIGNIRMANLYYFTWAAVLTSGLQMASYLKAVLPWQAEDYMSMVWAGICKVCFVILGSSLHIWMTISSNCTLDDIQSGAVTYCSRTILAIAVSLVGMGVGGSVVVGRMILGSRLVTRWLCCSDDNSSHSLCSNRLRAHVEAVISVFLVFLFGAAVALITGIGAPGQSVGDLYYATWLAFWVAIGIFVTCYEQIQWEDMMLQVEKYQQAQQQWHSSQKDVGGVVDVNNNYYRSLADVRAEAGEPLHYASGTLV